MIVYGTRPEAIKLAPVIAALKAHPEISVTTVVTAQHRAMLDQVNELFGIVPDHDLNIIQQRQTLAGITSRAVEGLYDVIAREEPDAVVVQGDTTTSFAGALAAFYHQVPVVHVEAGLRTQDPYSPFPEEINRRLTTQLTRLHLAPTPVSRAHLMAEGVVADNIVVTGNTVIDALLWSRSLPASRMDGGLAWLADDPRRMLLVTSHRRESWGEPMRDIGRALARLAEKYTDLLILFPIHKNPVVREAFMPAVEGLDNIRIIEPVEYGSFCALLDRCHLVLTDSGGIQEEGPSLGKPVLVMRDTTERPEAVAAGTARLVGTDADDIVREVSRLLDDSAAYDEMANTVNPYGDGQASRRSLEAILELFGLGPRPQEFSPAAS